MIKEAKRIAAKEDSEVIEDWGSDIEKTIDEADRVVRQLKEIVEEHNEQGVRQKHEKDLEYERKLFETRLQYKKELGEASVSGNLGKEEKPSSASPSAIPAKLPKLHINRFDGSYEDWPRFWIQFVEIIDKAEMPSVAKFAYPKPYLDNRVKKTVDGLLFTNEGYDRAKRILSDKYGKDSEVMKAYTKQIFDLPVIPNANAKRIHEFSDKLNFSVQSLQTMNKLEQVNGYVSMTLDKLPGIRGDLVRTDSSWESWNFTKLSEALLLWCRRNPVDHETPRKVDHKRGDKCYGTQAKNACVYCEVSSHKSLNCPNVVGPEERRKVLRTKRLCFNCTGSHFASNCKSNASCEFCHLKHHSSIHSPTAEKSARSEKIMAAHAGGDNTEVVHPVVVVEVDGIKTPALLDTGSGSSYASEKLIQALDKKPLDVRTGAGIKNNKG